MPLESGFKISWLAGWHAGWLDDVGLTAKNP